MNRHIYLALAGFIGFASFSMAQSNFRNADIMYKKEVVRAVDLREPQNKPLFAKNREITALLIKAVMNGKLIPYANDSLNTRLTLEDFTKKMTMPSTEPLSIDTAEIMINHPDDWPAILANPPKPDLYFAKDLYQMEIKEDIYFEKEMSKMDYQIKAITIFIPADHPANIKGIQDPVASFSYEDLIKLFKDNPNANYINPQNDAQHKNLADAFELRLFSSYIIKVSNPDDKYLSDVYNDPVKGIMASQWAAYDLLEYEHNLWEF